MKKSLCLLLSLFVILIFTSCKNNTIIKTNKIVASNVVSTSDENAYVKINSYKLNEDKTITWNINFLQNTDNIGSIFMYTLLYDKNGNPVNYHKAEVDPILNSSFDELKLIKDMKYPVNQSYDFKSGENTVIDYYKIKYCIKSIYYKDDKGNWLSWKNPNLDNWIKENSSK